MQTVWELVQPLEKVLADVVEEDMPDLHKYIGGSHDLNTININDRHQRSRS